MKPVRKAVLRGTALALISAFPAAAITALLYRFPVPFAGYLSGFQAVGPAVIAVIFYGIFGGFVVLALLGAMGGWVAYRIGAPAERQVRLLTYAFSTAAALAGALLLAVLDKIIGPW